MDLRSSTVLKDLVYSVPPSNRTHVIALMGRTRDSNLILTLERIRDFSSVEEDKKAADKALIALGS